MAKFIDLAKAMAHRLTADELAGAIRRNKKDPAMLEILKSELAWRERAPKLRIVKVVDLQIGDRLYHRDHTTTTVTSAGNAAAALPFGSHATGWLIFQTTGAILHTHSENLVDVVA